MKTIRTILACLAVALCALLAVNHPILATVVAISAGGAFMDPRRVLSESRLGTATLTLSGVTESLYQSRDTIARELTGAINGVTINGGAEGVSTGGTVISIVTAQPTLNTSYAPAMTIPEGDAQTVTAKTMTIGQVANVQIPLTGEVFKQLAATVGVRGALVQLFTQAMRTITNAIESHVCLVLKNGASRAVGTAGTTPFSSSHAVLLQAHQILKDNGAPDDGMTTAVLSTGAGTNLKSLANLYKANEAGGDDLLRRGTLSNIDNMLIRESAGVASHTAGTGASYLINNGNIAVGSTALTIDTGSGTILVGDVVDLESDTANRYVVSSTSAGTTDLTIQAPGLRKATVNNKTVTLAAGYTANPVFHRTAAELVMRPPAMPPNLTGGFGDGAQHRETIFDPKTGLVFEAALYLGYGKNMVDITTFYQAKAWKPEFIATILG